MKKHLISLFFMGALTAPSLSEAYPVTISVTNTSHVPPVDSPLYVMVSLTRSGDERPQYFKVAVPYPGVEPIQKIHQASDIHDTLWGFALWTTPLGPSDLYCKVEGTHPREESHYRTLFKSGPHNPIHEINIVIGEKGDDFDCIIRQPIWVHHHPDH